MNGKDQSPSGSGSCSMGSWAPDLSLSTRAELESAALALVSLSWAEGTSSVLLHLCRWLLLTCNKSDSLRETESTLRKQGGVRYLSLHMIKQKSCRRMSQTTAHLKRGTLSTLGSAEQQGCFLVRPGHGCIWLCIANPQLTTLGTSGEHNRKLSDQYAADAPPSTCPLRQGHSR
jgi:hypothetical protein